MLLSTRPAAADAVVDEACGGGGGGGDDDDDVASLSLPSAPERVPSGIRCDEK
jgi:hypothetical protein